ncbi:OPT/YSL family transporter [Candidatus Parabeggiatoa sp. HSG14]|uniref:OPT family oligopeptide transporter n=1 Tax=Candidatus Parabeggiatoa sp. HSG14 TaxID=3055593 RepID=UPI0025A77D64|nr:OPT/YSL family transporter [Thiotrichales bacterium HSG14]
MFDTRETYRELTIAAVLLGIIQGIILNIAFAYIALKLGFSIGGSAIAAIIGYVFLRGILRKGTIVENNINQTIASGINSAGTGVVFVLPAMFLLSTQEGGLTFSIWPLLLAGMGGAILGVLLIIPLRKQLIELERLRFPTGVAVATIIRSEGAGVSKAKLLGIGFLISASWKLIMILGWLDSPGLLEYEELNLSFGVLPAYLSPALYLSPLNFAAGLLAGRAGLPFFFGGILAWWVISPVSVSVGWIPSEIESAALVSFIDKQMLRPLGIGILIGAAFIEVIVNFPAIRSAIYSLSQATRSAKRTLIGVEEMPFWVLLTGIGAAIVFFFLAAWTTPGVSIAQAILVATLGTLWLGLAGLIVAQCTGLTDISPVSGIALISVTMMMVVLNGNIAAAMVVTIAVAVAIGQSADMMQDLKTGFMVGSRPFMQQLVQFGTSWLGVFIAFAVIYVLWSNGVGGQNGFGHDTPLPAPQADALKSVIEAVQNNTIPTDKFMLGGFVGILLGAAPIAGLGVLIGLAMYLPFSITLGYGLGCLTQMSITKQKGEAFTENKIVPLAAGLIIGEALMGVGNAVYEILSSTN